MDNNLNLTHEMLEKAKSASSATELLTLAQENGIAMTAEEAETYYTKLHPEIGALSDEELDNVGGGGLCGDYPEEKCERCGRTEFVYIRKENYGPWWYWYCKHCGLPYLYRK